MHFIIAERKEIGAPLNVSTIIDNCKHNLFRLYWCQLITNENKWIREISVDTSTKLEVKRNETYFPD